MAKKEVDVEINVRSGTNTQAPSEVDTACVYCYVDDKKCSPGTIANFAGERRECVIVAGVGRWVTYNLESGHMDPPEEDVYNCPTCYVDGKQESEGTIANFAGQRRECVVVNGQGVWKDF